MSIHSSSSLFFGCRETHFCAASSRVSATLDIGVRTTSPTSLYFEETKQRIANLIHNPQISVSTYDTAWAAMVPSPHSSHRPCFPNSLHWLLENQCPNGSWARPHHYSSLQKDVLSSTLACVLALKKWGVGEDHIHRGLCFIESNFASVMDDSQISPVGFNVVFPAMVEYARDMDLNLHLEKDTLDNLIQRRELELSRCYEDQSMKTKAYLAHICEGMGKTQNWEEVKKYQRRNGSLFNSPSATAAAFIGLPDASFLNYLQSALNKFGDAVPAIYPIDIYLKLCVVDNLEKLGIHQHFIEEIESVLDETYRFWVQDNEEIFQDASCCALAFRLLRKNGYDVASDQITKILQEYHSSSFSGNTEDVCIYLEFYRASEFVIYQDESELEKQNLRLKCLLEEELSSGFIYSNELMRNIEPEVYHTLEYPFYATLDRIEKHRNIKHYNTNNTRILKTAICSPSFGNTDLFSLSAQDFNKCQALHRKELKDLERWVTDNRLDELKFARNKSAYCYFSAAATIFDPSLSDARMSWAKNGILTTVVDDFFDCEGRIEELRQLIQLVEIWDVDAIRVEFASPNVEIIFSALKHTICDIGDKGFIRQGRPVTDHVVEIWLDLLKSMMKETEWAKGNTLPTVDEYMSNAYVSFALGPIVLPALYLVGPMLSEEMVQHPQYHNLFKLMSTCGRLLNDIRTCEREIKQGKLNVVPLYVNNTSGQITKETAIVEMKRSIDTHRRELLRLVLDGKNSVIPKPCKDLFWHMCTVVHLFYHKDDGFTSQDLIKVVKTIIHEPVVNEI